MDKKILNEIYNSNMDNIQVLTYERERIKKSDISLKTLKLIKLNNWIEILEKINNEIENSENLQQ